MNNLELRLRFILEKKLNIGLGEASPKTRADIQFPFITIEGKDYIVIPGSTIKGVLRTSLIRVSRLLGYRDVTSTVDPRDGMKPDIVTSMFGKPGDVFPSRVVVEQVLIPAEAASVFTLTHVRIDDDWGTAEEGGLFKVEYLPPKLEFNATLRVRDPSVEEVRALMMAILNLRFERFGRSGLADVRIVEARGIDPYLKDPVVKEIYEGLVVRE